MIVFLFESNTNVLFIVNAPPPLLSPLLFAPDTDADAEELELSAEADTADDAAANDGEEAAANDDELDADVCDKAFMDASLFKSVDDDLAEDKAKSAADTT